MDPYREAEVVERITERGACTWCKAEVSVIAGDDDLRCPRCGAQVAGPAARALRDKLLAEPDEPGLPQARPPWIGQVLALARTIVVVAGTIGMVAFAGWMVAVPPRPVFPLIGFLLCLPFGAVSLLDWLKQP